VNVRNRYCSHFWIREAKFKQLIQDFSQDFTTTWVAQLPCISFVNASHFKPDLFLYQITAASLMSKYCSPIQVNITSFWSVILNLLSAIIADIYKACWQVELFVKWIKQI